MKRRLRKPDRRNRRHLTAEPLEARRVLAASFGWDGPGLGSAELTYTIGNAPSSISQAEVDAAIETAFNAWASVADISFTEVTQTGLRDSIDITFANIDGRGGILAQAYFPDDVNRARIAGDIQFDLSEDWEVGNSRGSRAFDLAWVAAHEIGHSLGLDHSREPGAVLAAYVSPNQQFVALDSDDVSEIRQLYSASSGSVTSQTTPEPTTPPEPTVTEPTVTESSDPVTPNEPTDPNDSDSNNNEPSNRDNNPFRRWRWRWGGFWWRWGGRVNADVPEDQTVRAPMDVNNDGATSATDALVIINHLNRKSASGNGLYDVNGDGKITAADALMVINSLMRNETTVASEATPAEEPDESADGELDPDSSLDGELDQEDETTDPIDDGSFPDDEADDGSRLHDHHHHRFGRGRLLRGNTDRLFTRFDTNEDDALIEEELPEFLWQRLVDKNIDASGDGSIAREEFDAYATAQRAERFARKDSDESGALTEDELSPRFWGKLSAADTNQDGGVSLEELEIWLAERRTEVPEAENTEGEPEDADRDQEEPGDEEDLDEQDFDEDETEAGELDEDDSDADEIDDEACDDVEMDGDGPESGSLRLAHHRSDRLFARLGRGIGRR